MPDPAGRSRGLTRMLDTIEHLYRRRRIDARQRQAAETYRDAIELCRGSIPSPLDATRTRGGGIAAPSEVACQAAQTVAGAERVVGSIDTRLLRVVLGEGCGLEEAARRLFRQGGKPSQRDVEHIGRRLREALGALADHWWPVKQRHITGSRSESVGAGSTSVTVERGRAVHATAQECYEIGKPLDNPTGQG